MASSSESHGGILKRANPNTIQDKFLVGYQGWFTCAGDGPPVHKGHHGWLHWFNKPVPDGGKPTIDLWPDVSDYTSDELFPVPWYTLPSTSADPSTVHPQLFSSRHPRTVQRHFHWMALHGVDGVFLQRFAGQCVSDPSDTTSATADIMRIRDEVLDRVREAAEKEGRVWAIMYDVSGVPDDKIERIIKVDWEHLLRDKKILESPWYLKENGRPVIALWGFGFSGRHQSPSTVHRIVRHLRSVTPTTSGPSRGAYIMAGTPTHWRTPGQGDADPNPDFLRLWLDEFDAISPWTVGRFHDEETIDRFAREKLAKDITVIKNKERDGGRESKKVDYVPVVFPGSSGFNLSDGRWKFNEQPRDGGRFLWRQLYQIRRVLGSERGRIVYGAMWDEYDEGTAFLPAVANKRQLPVEGKFLSLDAEGHDLPTDWYMRIAGFIGEALRGERDEGHVHETFPLKDLQDYWSSRPHYEPAPGSTLPCTAAASSSSPTALTFEEWCRQEVGNEVEDVPPPPYTLEAGMEAGTISSTSQPPVPIQTRPLPPSSSSNGGPGPGTGQSSSSLEGRPPAVPPLSSRPSVSSHQPTLAPPAPPLSSRPSMSSALGSPSSQANPANMDAPYTIYNPSNRRPSHSGAGNAVDSPASHPQRPNPDTHPHPPQSATYNPVYLSDRFGEQSLDDRPAHGQALMQWNVQPQAQAQAYSAALSPPPPPTRPATRPRPSPTHSPSHSHRHSPSPSHSHRHSPRPGQSQVDVGGGFLQPQTPYQYQQGPQPEAPYAPHMMPYTNHSAGHRPSFEGPASVYPNAYPDVTQAWGMPAPPRAPVPAGREYGHNHNELYGEGAGGFYAAPGMGSTTPQVPPRPPGMASPTSAAAAHGRPVSYHSGSGSGPPPVPAPAPILAESESSDSTSPSTSSTSPRPPGGFIPGPRGGLFGLGDIAYRAKDISTTRISCISERARRTVEDSITNLQSAGTKLTTEARKQVEDGKESLSSARSKVIQKFHG